LNFRIQLADADYKKAFDDELVAFKDRIRRRAVEKIEEAVKEAEEEERKARLGPGGLDPVEVFESLPDVRARDPFLTSPLGANFDPRGEFCPLGVKFSVHPSFLLNSRVGSPFIRSFSCYNTCTEVVTYI
jgi:hypothetical protein